MAKSPKLENSLEKDAEFRFFDTFGNILDAVETYGVIFRKRHSLEILKKIKGLKNQFYREINNFKGSCYVPKGKIKPNSLKKLDDFRNLNWAVQERIEKIKKYINSLKSYN